MRTRRGKLLPVFIGRECRLDVEGWKASFGRRANGVGQNADDIHHRIGGLGEGSGCFYYSICRVGVKHTLT